MIQKYACANESFLLISFSLGLLVYFLIHFSKVRVLFKTFIWMVGCVGWLIVLFTNITIRNAINNIYWYNIYRLLACFLIFDCLLFFMIFFLLQIFNYYFNTKTLYLLIFNFFSRFCLIVWLLAWLFDWLIFLFAIQVACIIFL